MENKKDLQEHAHSLVNTSVDDMQSGLYFYVGTDAEHVEIVKRGLAICKRRDEKTKVRIIEAKIKKMKKEEFEVLRLRLIDEAFKEGE